MPLMGLLCRHGRDDAYGIWQLPCSPVGSWERAEMDGFWG